DVEADLLPDRDRVATGARDELAEHDDVLQLERHLASGAAPHDAAPAPGREADDGPAVPDLAVRALALAVARRFAALAVRFRVQPESGRRRRLVGIGRGDQRTSSTAAARATASNSSKRSPSFRRARRSPSFRRAR